jgi:hypothetical protein
MKNVITNTKKGILMVTLLTTVIGFAKDADLSLIKKGAKKTALVIENVKQGNLLTITDSYGIVLYKEFIQTNGVYKKGFDLTELPNGDYVFELEKDLEIKTIPFKVEFSNVIFSKADETTYFKPYIRQEGNVVYLTKLSPKFDSTTVKVYALGNGSPKLCHTETIDNTQVVEKVFKLEKGNFKITVNSNNKEHTTIINN